MSASPTIDELIVGADAEVWRGLGFAIDGDGCAVGSVRIRLAGAEAGSGIVAWSLRDAATAELDGLPTSLSSAPPPQPGEHANGAVSIDHVVVATPDLVRTAAALEAAGLELRREREAGTAEQPLVQCFYRLGEVILELVGPPEPEGEGPASFWGMVFVVREMGLARAALGGGLGGERDAVQPGRRIATARMEAGLGVRAAFMTPAAR